MSFGSMQKMEGMYLEAGASANESQLALAESQQEFAAKNHEEKALDLVAQGRFVLVNR